jgi:hypothetical protein
MSHAITPSKSTAADLAAMHEVYRSGGEERAAAPHVIYQDAECPHSGCRQYLQAIVFRLEAFGRAVHDALVRAWWADTGFAGQCPACHGWVHFTIRGKQAVAADEAAKLPQLPDAWFDEAVVL